MPTDLIYDVGRVGTGIYSHRDTLAAGVDLFGERMSTITAPYNLRVNGEEWGKQDRPRRDALARTREVARHGDAGTTIAVRSATRENEPHFVLKLALESLGSVVIRYAIKQLGVPYLWAAVDPAGPAGGPGSGLDCSGLCLVCYAQADVILPHNSEAIRQLISSKGGLFQNKARVKPGDLVFFHTDDRNGPNAASHIAICLDKTRMIVAPHTGAFVQRQDIASVPGFMAYGFIKAVTGTH